MRNINKIIIHCSDSDWGNAELIDRWHKARGWSEIGYHFVVLNGKETANNYNYQTDGLLEQGRSSEMIGAHCLGENASSLGVCLIGKKIFTQTQMKNLKILISYLIYNYGVLLENVLGHYETESGKNQGKTCPNIDMKLLRDEVAIMLKTIRSGGG